jgi:glycosyltransferase involved in cell wall biosynthesis
MTPLVSVVLPVRNGARFIEASVKSVLAQQWRPLELIVVDGHSTDGTLGMLERFDAPELRVIQQDGRGIPGAWNQGIAAARGEFVAFISADDEWTPKKLSTQLAVMVPHTTLLYTIANFRYEPVAGVQIPRTFNPSLLDRNLVGRIMETLVARKEAFDIVGVLDETFATAHDVDWYARANELGVSHAVLDDVLLIKRIHDENASADASTNTPQLMEVLRRSIARRRAGP